MNELELLHRLDDHVELPPLGELSIARARLTAAITVERSRRRGRRTRSGALVCLTAAAAAAAAVALVAAGSPRASRPTLPTPSFDLTAAQVLNNAAFVALRVSSAAPTGWQYVYKETKVAGGGVVRSWLSVDGTRTSIVGPLTIPSHPRPPVSRRRTGTGWRWVSGPRAYFPGMPTRASEMGGYLRRTQGVRPGNLNDLAKTVGSLLDFDYLLPSQQAALFAFLASTRGITVVRHITDAAGRAGIGVGWSFGASTAMLIFDPATYRYLGTTTEGTRGQVSGTALLQTAIVDHLGQVPRSASSPNA